MKVYLEKTGEVKEINAKDVKSLLEMLKINTTTVIVSKNGKLVTEDTLLNKEDEIKIIPVISGG